MAALLEEKKKEIDKKRNTHTQRQRERERDEFSSWNRAERSRRKQEFGEANGVLKSVFQSFTLLLCKQFEAVRDT